ncbi:MAG: metal-dependent hydrolase [Methanosphaera sp.]|uniref:metal-dependent hydrolase n=1 Tax=Methanosphaera sp. TaxID=2666342 RepID=UPI0025F8614E|nr:metal-dependent hydrolase [Methanosphaera sp.]MCI5866576.1 metal-dependent hydrolase [Methanosphaera sp.]MDD6535053.1 metal-dependent hydrolase [Methanosphaera sp.]MDY3955485.1 metal-dependent hydrolase [Methanosphaera sp.]
MDIKYYGHSAFQITTQEGLKILIDPFISGNEKCLTPVELINPDVILITHGHSDHFGDAMEIANNSSALIIGTHEIANFIQKQGLEAIGMNIGGTVSINDLVNISMVDAKHTSSLDFTENAEVGGSAIGYIITLENGKKIYFAGDTGLFGDMKTVIGDIYKPDIALLPIGDRFTMGPEDAAIAAKWLNVRIVIPMHYNTFDAIAQDPELFADMVSEKAAGTYTVILDPGETYSEE